jgi:hypothetical protein
LRLPITAAPLEFGGMHTILTDPSFSPFPCVQANQGASSFAKVTLEVGGRAFPMPYALQ